MHSYACEQGAHMRMHGSDLCLPCWGCGAWGAPTPGTRVCRPAQVKQAPRHGSNKPSSARQWAQEQHSLPGGAGAAQVQRSPSPQHAQNGRAAAACLLASLCGRQAHLVLRQERVHIHCILAAPYWERSAEAVPSVSAGEAGRRSRAGTVSNPCWPALAMRLPGPATTACWVSPDGGVGRDVASPKGVGAGRRLQGAEGRRRAVRWVGWADPECRSWRCRSCRCQLLLVLEADLELTPSCT